MPTEKIDLRPLKKWLGKGEILEICQEVGISRSQGSNIIKGKSQNLYFVQKFMEHVERNKALYQRAESMRDFQP